VTRILYNLCNPYGLRNKHCKGCKECWIGLAITIKPRRMCNLIILDRFKVVWEIAFSANTKIIFQKEFIYEFEFIDGEGSC
jgi:hypothetical protein